VFARQVIVGEDDVVRVSPTDRDGALIELENPTRDAALEDLENYHRVGTTDRQYSRKNQAHGTVGRVILAGVSPS
jgi:hypothetical protein